jgi:ubiquinone/menaquinone biosynthesis C-methylase UbiE
MTDSRNDVIDTYRIFQHERVAAGYASSRPFLHRQVYARVQELIRHETPLPRALDVGCGTGMSSIALIAMAREVVGIDTSMDMLRRAERDDRVRYLAGTAEDLPFRKGCFDLVAACGSIAWVDRERFMPRSRDVLTRGGWLILLDFGDTGRSTEVVDLERWHRESFMRLYPRPTRRDPIVTEAEAARYGYSATGVYRLDLACSFTAQQYVDFLMTESRVIAAVEHGDQEARQCRTWLESEIVPLFNGRAVEVAFDGYIQTLQKL